MCGPVINEQEKRSELISLFSALVNFPEEEEYIQIGEDDEQDPIGDQIEELLNNEELIDELAEEFRRG